MTRATEVDSMEKTLFFEMTLQKVMVVYHIRQSPDAEWEELVKYYEQRAKELAGVLVYVVGDTGPTPKQRHRVKDAMKEVPRTTPVVMLADSAIARGVLTALNWFTGRGDVSYAFHTRDLERGLQALNLSTAATNEARELMRKLQAEAGAQAA